ncbi:HlyC/CorC family transporter [Candidatus Parcubacteria bacterium]|nr:MAG: HlyC/CorC family transporter [Candidatus Parcubacteria bacterium]
MPIESDIEISLQNMAFLQAVAAHAVQWYSVVEMEVIFQLALVLFLVFLNGYFVASEFALVAVRKTRIEELVKKGNSATAKLVQKALGDLDRFIAATQLGITIASLALGWIGEPAIAHTIEPLLAAILPETAALISAHTIAVIIAFTIITSLHIVLGELAPKTIALQRAEATSLWIIAPLAIFLKVFSPFIAILNGAGRLVLKLLGFTPAAGHHLVHSEEEIRSLLAQSVEGGIIPSKEAEMVYRVFRFGDTQVEHIMVPRTDIIALDILSTLRQIEKEVHRHPHSRFPVYEGSVDTVVGFVHIKDIYREILKSGEDKRLSETSLLRKIIDVPETTRIDDLLLQMRKKRVHIAIISDEYGGTAGMVTLEDVLERLVGEIQDEFEQPEQDILKQADGSFIIDGLTPIERVQNNVPLPVKGQGYTTIGGLVFGLLGRQPVLGDSVQLGSSILRVEEMEGKRIKTLRLIEERT